MDFKDQVIWITGGSSGIGEHLAYAFAEQGAKLVLSSRNEQELERVRHNCGKDSDVLLLPADVTDFATLPALAEKVIEHFGYLNILVNNAGVSQRSLVKDTDFSVDQKIMEVNFLGTVALTKAVLPYFYKQHFGHVVVISSVVGKIGTPLRSAYAASKHALHGFFDSMRAETAEDGIKVTLICPGFVRTNVTINALKGDGSKNNVMADSTQNGLDPAVFAQKALRVINREKREVIIAGFREAMGVQVKRFFPGLFANMIKRIKVT